MEGVDAGAGHEIIYARAISPQQGQSVFGAPIFPVYRMKMSALPRVIEG
jgi:hypothetical protein